MGSKGVGRMWRSISEDVAPTEMRIFRNGDDARIWLARDEG